MPEFTLSESTFEEFETLPEDTVLPAVVRKVEQRTSPFDVDPNDPSKGKREEVSFQFQVTEGEHQGRVFFGNTPTYFDASPNCRLRVWVEEILGVDELPVGFKFDTDDLVDLPVNIALGVGKKKGKNYVADVMRVRGGAVAAAPAAASAAPSDDGEPF